MRPAGRRSLGTRTAGRLPYVPDAERPGGGGGSQGGVAHVREVREVRSVRVFHPLPDVVDVIERDGDQSGEYGVLRLPG